MKKNDVVGLVSMTHFRWFLLFVALIYTLGMYFEYGVIREGKKKDKDKKKKKKKKKKEKKKEDKKGGNVFSKTAKSVSKVASQPAKAVSNVVSQPAKAVSNVASKSAKAVNTAVVQPTAKAVNNAVVKPITTAAKVVNKEVFQPIAKTATAVFTPKKSEWAKELETERDEARKLADQYKTQSAQYEKQLILDYANDVSALDFNSETGETEKRNKKMRYDEVLKQTTVSGAKNVYAKYIKEFNNDDVKTRNLVNAVAVRTNALSFPLTNTESDKKYRYGVVSSKKTLKDAEDTYTFFKNSSIIEAGQKKGIDDAKKKTDKEIEDAKKAADKALEAMRAAVAAQIKAANAQTRAAKEYAERLRKEAAAASAASKEMSDAEKERLRKLEIEVKSERDNADLQKRLAEKAMSDSRARQIELDKLIEGAKNSTSNFGRELAIARERAQRAELAIDVERERGDAAKRKEVARCSAEKAKAEERRRRQEQIRINRAQLKAAEERAKIAAAKTERERVESLRRQRAKELADERINKLRELRTGLVESRRIHEDETQMMQVATTSDLLASQSQKGIGGGINMYSSSPAAALGPDGMPTQFNIDNLYQDRSTNSYLNRGAADNIYVDRSTLGGYMGPMNYELYANAKQIPK